MSNLHNMKNSCKKLQKSLKNMNTKTKHTFFFDTYYDMKFLQQT